VVMDQNGLAGTAMRILGNRNIGIGTTTPGYALDVAGTARADVLRVGTGTGTEAGDDNVVRPASANAFLNLKGGAGKSKIVLGNSFVSLIAGADAGADHISFRNGATDSTSKGTEVMRIAGNGNVGIGTAAPSTPLEIKYGSGHGLQITKTNNYPSLALKEDGGDVWDISSQSTRFEIGYTQNGGARVAPLSIIESTGNVGIGIVTPAATLDVNGFAKLKKNTTAPAICNSTYEGSIALTSAVRMCVCDGTSWKEVNSPTACTW